MTSVSVQIIEHRCEEERVDDVTKHRCEEKRVDLSDRQYELGRVDVTDRASRMQSSIDANDRASMSVSESIRSIASIVLSERRHK